MENNIFKRIGVKERLPETSDWYDTDKGNLYWFENHNVWSCRDDRISEENPNVWYEEVTATRINVDAPIEMKLKLMLLKHVQLNTSHKDLSLIEPNLIKCGLDAMYEAVSTLQKEVPLTERIALITSRDFWAEIVANNLFAIDFGNTEQCKMIGYKIVNKDFTAILKELSTISGGKEQSNENKVHELSVFLEYVRDNYTGMGSPHLVHNKGGQRKTNAIVEEYLSVTGKTASNKVMPTNLFKRMLNWVDAEITKDLFIQEYNGLIDIEEDKITHLKSIEKAKYDLIIMLKDAIDRMDRARDILRKDENSNWGMLDTERLKTYLSAITAQHEGKKTIITKELLKSKGFVEYKKETKNSRKTEQLIYKDLVIFEFGGANIPTLRKKINDTDSELVAGLTHWEDVNAYIYSDFREITTQEIIH